MGGGKNQSASSQQSTSQDIGWLKPYYEDLAKRTSDASKTVSNQPYGGNFVAQATPNERAGTGIIANAANSLPGALAPLAAAQQGQAQNYAGSGNAVLNLGMQQARGDFLDPTNPVLNGAIQAAVNPIADVFNANRQRLENTASAQGASGNSRIDVLRNRMMSDFTRSAGDVTAGLVNNWYGRERGLQQNAPQLIAQAAQLEGAPQSVVSSSVAPTVAAGQLIGRAGELERGLDTLGIQNELAKFQESQTAPYRPLYPMAQLLGAIPTPTQTTSTGMTTQQGASNPLAGGLQGALGGASMGSMFGPWGAVLGGLGGGIFGGLAG